MTEILRMKEMRECKACQGFGCVPYVEAAKMAFGSPLLDEIEFTIVTCPVCKGEGEVSE